MDDFIRFVFVFGAAIIVVTLVLMDFFEVRAKKRPYIKWIIITLLSLWQASCWRGLSNFDSAFGNSTDLKWYEIGFIALICIWIVFKFLRYVRVKKSDSNPGES